ncbi:arginine--tRNA ligase [Candidatus Uhrbacteria bacterium]|nr:arginine--tRNA ligase [Candidatus Uhrbacteria bacterium]
MRQYSKRPQLNDCFFETITYNVSMNNVETIKKSIAAQIQKQLKIMGADFSVSADLLETPPDSTMGDLAFPCFALAKELKRSPSQIAYELATLVSSRAKRSEAEGSTHVKNRHRFLATLGMTKSVGPYVNFFLSPKAISEMALSHSTPPRRARGRSGSSRVVIEYVSPNTNKPLHLGHVRNAVLGDSIARIMESTGKTVIKTCLVNDRGIHICKSMIAYMKAATRNEERGARFPTPRSTGKKGDHFVGDYYVLFEQMLKKDASLAGLAQECLQKWEEGDAATRALWKKMNAWVLAGMKETYKRLGIAFDKTYFESAIYDKGKDTILAKLKKGVVKKDETNAVFADLSEEKLPNKILLRKDGTALYITQDIFLAREKFKDFRASSSLYVIGSEQNLYMQQLFAILNQFGYPWAKSLHHVSYGMVNLPEGKMKSREGTVVDADDILDDLERMVTGEIKKRDQILSAKEVLSRAKIIALAAIKFYMADVSPKSDMTFDPKKSIALQGRTGPYILYTYARLKSILRKAGKAARSKKGNYDWTSEKPIALQLVSFDEMLAASARDLNPSLVCQYAFSLAQKVNDYYHVTPVLNAPPLERACRLALIGRTANTLKKALELLGIPILEKM